MTSVPDSVSDDVILEDPGEDPDQWPEFRGDRPKGKLEKIRWGQGVRSEEEEYLAKLENKLARVKTGERAADNVPPREQTKEDLFDTSVSLASSPSEHDYLSDHFEDSEEELEEEEVEDTNAKPIEADNPGLPLLWDQPAVEVEEDEGREEEGEKLDVKSAENRSLPVTPDRSRSLVIRSSERPGLTSNDSKVRFFGRVRVTSGRRAVSSQYRARSPRITTPPVATTKSLSSSIASSVTMSLRGTPTSSWLFPSMTPLSTPSEAPARDYFSYVSPASSIRRSGTMTPRDPEVEEVAARAARARALTWAPNRRTSSSDARDRRRAASANGHLMLKTEDGVIWGSWKTRLTTMKWWTWKMRRVWYAIQMFWCHADDDDEEDEERRMFVRE